MREIGATDGQRVLWFMDHYRGGNGTMSVPLLFRMRGPLDAGALRCALDDVGARHEALRSTFRRQHGQLMMTCHEERQIALTVTDLPGADADSVGEFVRQLLRADADTAETVARATLLRLAPHDHLLVLDVHHLVTDAWSNRLITRDLATCYNRRLARLRHRCRRWNGSNPITPSGSGSTLTAMSAMATRRSGGSTSAGPVILACLRWTGPA